MENETELIRQQMLETRSALSEKLEALQEQVLSTVEGTTRTVTETVQTVQDAVQDTVSTVSESVQGTVETVKETFDISRQVENHPWLMVGGAVAVGYLGGRLLEPALRQLSSGSTSGMGYMASNGHVPSGPPQPQRPSWLDAVAGPVFKQLQDLALGALTGVAADLIMERAPEGMRGKLQEMTNEVASSLGTTPIRGILSEFASQKKQENEKNTPETH
jgi:ElaB/YqjD/DUF883 family membrane-anchored ribosome-binding protein